MVTNLEYSPTSRADQASVDYTAVKTRQQATWASGDFAVIGSTLQIVGESLCEAVDLRAGARVLDVACGNGNAALAAARRWAKVIGLDYVPALLQNASARAKADGLALDLVEGDAENLPFVDAQFDVALSTYGIMFAPDQERAAREIMRVVKPGGRIGLANWTPEGFIGQLLKTVGKHVPPPAGVASPALWGTSARLQQLFRGARAVHTTHKDFVFRYESAAHFIDVFRRFYGPTHVAFNKLEAAEQTRLIADIRDLSAKFSRHAASFVVPAEYLEVVIER